MAVPASSASSASASAPGSSAALDTPADARAALTQLRQAAQKLAADTISSPQRLSALEELRTRALRHLPLLRAHYVGQPQPLSDDERLAWEEQVALWHAFYFGFALCGDLLDPDAAAMVWTRALDSLGRAIREHGRVYRAVPPILWKELNSCYRTAEACAVHTVAVPGGDSPALTPSCNSVYLHTLLHDAAHLGALSGAQIEIVEQWLPDWVRDVKLLDAAPAQAERSPLAVDLSGDAGPALLRELPHDGQMRHLDTSALGTRLRALAAALRERRSAPELDWVLQALPRPTVERLLTHLYVQWCSSGARRKEERLERPVRAQVAVTMHAMHFQISGRAFRQPGLRYTHEEEHDLATFGHITERTEQRLLTGRSAALEPWDIVNQGSAGSFGIRRSPGLPSRVGHGQLIAVRTSSALPPKLGTIQRLLTESDGTIVAGVRLISTEARGVAIRPAVATTAKFERALLLAPDAERHQPETLIVPREQFKPGTMLEMHESRTEKVQLGELLERGAEFDRMACERT